MWQKCQFVTLLFKSVAGSYVLMKTCMFYLAIAHIDFVLSEGQWEKIVNSSHRIMQ